jgi:membrane-associated phospholipid phosphatase
VLSASWVLALALTVQAPAAAVRPNSEWSDDHPFTRLLHNLGTDFKNLPTSTNAAIIGVGALGAIAVHRYDAPLSGWAKAQGSSSYTKIGNVSGTGYTQAGVAVGTYAIGKLTHDDVAIHIGSDLIRGQLLNGIFTESLKIGVNRTRPTGSAYSFPSGHTSASFTTAAVLEAHFGWGVGAAAYAAAGFVGWTRLRDDQHWLSDVAFGSAMGILAGHTVTLGHHVPVQVVPTRTPHGGPAVIVMWTPGPRAARD